MLPLNFIKMHGIGNDFIVAHHVTADDPAAAIDGNLARALCDRRFGIGADGVIVIGPSATADHRVTIFNSDGSTAEMCGNGIRCCALYVTLRGLSRPSPVVFETGAGPITVETREGNRFRVTMGPPETAAGNIPTTQSSGRVIMHELVAAGQKVSITALSMGNPHAVLFTEELTDDLVLRIGPALEHHEFFPKKTNVEFVRVISNRELAMRVWERGCGETLACGTGACAAVVAGVLTGRTGGEVTVHLKGGDLAVAWDGRETSPVYLTGPAAVVFEGRVGLSP